MSAANHDSVNMKPTAGSSAAILDCLAGQLVAGLAAAPVQVDAAAEPTPDPHPALRVVRGDPSDTEIATLVAVFAAVHTSAQSLPQSPMNTLGDWGIPTGQLRYGIGTAPAHFVHAHYSR